jgi:DMSO/TMAO reductase YedYZ molybdopterin-dependent catalytic subunit
MTDSPDTPLPPDPEPTPQPQSQPETPPEPQPEPTPQPASQQQPVPKPEPQRPTDTPAAEYTSATQPSETAPAPAPELAPAAQAPESAPAHAPEPTPEPAPTKTNLRQTLAKATGYSNDLTPDQQITRRTFVSFSAFALLGAAAWKSWFWIKDAAQNSGVQSPLRKGLNLDDKVFKHTLSPNHLAKTYPPAQAAKNVRYNSPIGLGADPSTWRLRIAKASGETLSLSLDELKTLPKTDFAFEFKCIEGWSQISWWGGVRFSDFVRHYNLQKEAALDYVGLSTPDDHYYVGVDTPSMMHPQTILCYEMSGQPLPTRHGAPLRLIIPVKYGVKNLKCVGKLFFSNDRPRDYWFERGYDYYCGL